MARLRLVFVVLAVALMVPLALLLEQALASVEVEREVRHRAVADRILDEMERELSTWLGREEDRPYAHYRYLFLPDNMPAARGVYERSPLADPPVEPFVLGPFQFNPDGTFETPLWPRDEVQTGLLTAWNPPAELRRRVADIQDTVQGLWAVPAAEKERNEPVQQLAGTTVALEQKKKALEKEEEVRYESPLEETVKVLNRGAQGRSQRPSKQAFTQALNVYGTDDRELEDSLEAEDTLGEGRRSLEAAAGGSTPEEQTVDVFLEPMVGRPVHGGRLVLYRTVLIQQQAYRQGVVIDREALVRWLGQRVLEVPDLAVRARIASVLGEETAGVEAVQTDPGTYAYRHRFAEPFAAVTAVLVLE